MSRRLTLLFSAFEALLVVAIGVAIPLTVSTAMWAIQFGFAIDWTVFWRASVDVWLIGHGVDTRFALDEVTAATIGAPAGTVVVVTIAALGIGMLTLLLGVRAGSRVAETGHRIIGEVTAFLVFAGLSLLVTFSALQPDARPSLWQGTLLPATVFGVGLAVGVLRERALSGRKPSPLRRRIDELDPRWLATVGAGVKAGAATAALVLLAASVLVAVMLLIHYAQVIRLYESLHTGVLGGIALTAAQLAFVPNIVIWAASWLIGPGFALGVGSTVGPAGTALGPLPAIPVLGALPGGETAFGFVGIAVPVVAAFLAASAVRPALVRTVGDGSRVGWLALATLVAGLFGGLVLGVLAAISSGSIGPGRFSEVGPDPVAVGVVAAIELAVGCGIGFAVGALPGLAARITRREPVGVASDDR